MDEIVKSGKRFRKPNTKNVSLGSSDQGNGSNDSSLDPSDRNNRRGSKVFRFTSTTLQFFLLNN